MGSNNLNNPLMGGLIGVVALAGGYPQNAHDNFFGDWSPKCNIPMMDPWDERNIYLH